MFIRHGYEIILACPTPTPAHLLMEAHREVAGMRAQTRSFASFDQLRDVHGNRLQRLMLPAGEICLSHDGVVETSAEPEPTLDPRLGGDQVLALPPEVLIHLNASRYCESDLLGAIAWERLGSVPPGGARIRAIFDLVHHHIAFDYAHADATRTALGAWNERRGVCRDFAHLAIALCRAMNIPARYCNGYLGDIGVAPDPAPMDFNAWCEVWCGGRWHVMDARHNTPRIGRILIARGRDAADIPMINTFGPHVLKGFRVWTHTQPDASLAEPPERHERALAG